MAEPRIIIIGHSHVNAMRGALRACAFSSTPTEVLRHVEDSYAKSPEVVYLHEATVLAGTLGPDDLLALTFGGNQYNIVGLMRHPEPFDFLLPSNAQEDYSPETQPIPYQAMRAHFASSLQNGFGKLFEQISQASQAPVICLEVPPPKEDESYILRAADAYFLERGISDVGVTPAPLRLKLWRAQQEAVAVLCDKIGICYVPCPHDTRDAKGYLAPAYYAPDATHANADYGLHVLRQLEHILRTHSGRRADLKSKAVQ